MKARVNGYDIAPVSAERWPHLVELFSSKGDAASCWCQWYRVPAKTFEANGRDGNRHAMELLVNANNEPGLIAYENGKPVGWVSVAPRREHARIETKADSGVVSEEGVWSVVCFFIAAGKRGEGVATALLSGAADFAREHGARILEGYPIDRDSPISNSDAYTGVPSMFIKQGFREIGRFDRWAAVPDVAGPNARKLARPPGRPVMRLEL
jgi:GNAT superfamily N-acetyltransferase